ncbi:MAG: hypothetical protein L0G22_03095 [Propionibacteriaceae bacterium]|nr:hypothetical protein [Propionibacteriaceae bacterium]
MTRRAWILARDTPLTKALPGSQFVEYHCSAVDGGPERAFEAFHRLTWSDLRIGRIMLSIRGFGLIGEALRRPIVTPPSPAAPVHEVPPRYTTSAMIGKPWMPVPASRPVTSLDDVRVFDEPGWLKYGMEWSFTGTDDGRTFVETVTLCEATSRSAQLLFGAYWAVIRLGSASIRRELLHAIAVAVGSGGVSAIGAEGARSH